MPQRPIHLSPTGVREAIAMAQQSPSIDTEVREAIAMPQESPSIDTGNTFSLREAAALVGVSVDTIKRRHTDGVFPNARQEPGRSGPQWRIPAVELAAVADEQGWTLDLATALPQQVPQHSEELHDLLRDALESSEAKAQALADALAKNADAEAKQSIAEERLEERSRERDQARSDRDHADAQLSRMATDLAEMTGRADELRTELEGERADIVKLRDELQAKAVDVALYEQRLLDLAGEADDLTQSLVDARHRSERVEADAERMMASMGWLARRRYMKSTT